MLQSLRRSCLEGNIVETAKTPEKVTLESIVKKGRVSQIGGRVILTISLAVVGIVSLVAYLRYQKDQPAADGGASKLTLGTDGPEITTPDPSQRKVPSELDGTLVLESANDRRPLAVVIENHPDARPQFGLTQASIVYEAVAEGGITRCLAIFGPGGGQKVGPVRSARPYAVDWAREYDAGYAHVGGSPLGLARIKEIGARDLDQFAIGSRAFRREPRVGVATEHTMYTDTEKLAAIALEKFGSQFSLKNKPQFKAPLGRDLRPAGQTVTIDFSSEQFRVAWTYDPEDNSYLRSLGGRLHKDGSNDQTIRAANIFIQETVRPNVETIQVIGSGKIRALIDGREIQGTWEKKAATEPTKFFDATGTEIKRNPGQTWIEVIHPGMNVTVTDPTATAAPTQ